MALNISEDSGGTDKEFLKLLRTSSNSLKECVVYTTIATRQNYISEQINQKSRKDLVEISKMISGLRKYLRNKK
ncbi:four helix bundle protein [Salegentibacter sp. JZCK2]|nr:four helix bundle protein [Salegentibacter tibetensis]